MTDRPPLHVAAAVIGDGAGRTLLVRKRRTAVFMQAGGKIEPGETALEALRRELAEELGVTVAAEDCVAIGVVEADAANEPGLRVRAELFAVDLPGPIRAGGEIEEILWLSPGDPVPTLAPLTRDHVLTRPNPDGA